MKIKLSQLRRIIREALQSDDNNHLGPLGQVAFGEIRSDMPKEKNTPREGELAIALWKHFNQNAHLSPDFSELLQQCLDNPLYDDIIKEPLGGTTVYRGLVGMTSEWLSKLTGLSLDRINRDGELFSTEDCNFNFTPAHPGASSWTDEMSEAKKFASTATHDLAVIICADTSENKKKFISCEEGLYKIKKFATYPEEREIIGIGTISCFSVTWKKLVFSV